LCAGMIILLCLRERRKRALNDVRLIQLEHHTKIPTAVIGMIGGSGVYGLEGMQNKKEIEIDTPFGKPSSKIMIGELEGITVAFLARHDVTHRLSPSEVPYRANIYALKLLGVKYLICIFCLWIFKGTYKAHGYCPL